MGEAKRKNKPSFFFKDKVRSATTAVLIVLCAVGVIDIVYRQYHPLINVNDPARTVGDPTASIKIIEFMDFQCPECARGAKVLKSFLIKYPHDIQLSIKYYPQRERNSLPGAIHAECAARQGLFWPYYYELITKQNQWRLMVEVKPYLLFLAENVSMDMNMFKACVEDMDAERIIREEHRLGEAYAVHSTPTYFINGKMFVGVDEMEEYLNDYFLKKRLGLL